MIRWIAVVAIALVAGFGGAAAWTYSGLGHESTRAYLLENPEFLPEAIEELQRRQTAEMLEPLRIELEAPYPGAVLGNPNGSLTLVEFSDYACGYCRQSVPDVEALIAANPDLRVVIRELPVLSPQSVEAARMALAAARQGKFETFHKAMYTKDTLSAENIAAAATEAGVDLAAAQAAIEQGQFERQLQNNYALAQQLGFTGTPSWVIGNEVMNGAVGRARLAEAIDTARAAAEES